LRIVARRNTRDVAPGVKGSWANIALAGRLTAAIAEV